MNSKLQEENKRQTRTAKKANEQISNLERELNSSHSLKRGLEEKEDEMKKTSLGMEREKRELTFKLKEFENKLTVLHKERQQKSAELESTKLKVAEKQENYKEIVKELGGTLDDETHN